MLQDWLIFPEMAFAKLSSTEDFNKTMENFKDFSSAGELGISVDMIQVAPFQIGFIIKGELADKAEKC